MVLPSAGSQAEPLFDMNSRFVKPVQRMFKRCSVEHGPPQPKQYLEASSAERDLFETAIA
jgi:hypothetical protein